MRTLQHQLKEYDEVEFNIKKESVQLEELEVKVEKLEREMRDFRNSHKLQDSSDALKKQSKTDENLETRLNVVSNH